MIHTPVITMVRNATLSGPHKTLRTDPPPREAPGTALELVLFVGVQASGKTTFYNQRFAATHEHVSKDRMRSNPHPERRQQHVIAVALTQRYSVVVDNTNATFADRASLILLGKTHGAQVIAYAFTGTVSDSLRRNATREGRARVPPVAIFTTARKLAWPVYAEGFDQIFRVTLHDAEGYTVVRVPPTYP